MKRNLVTGDALALIEQLRDRLRAERVLHDQLDATRNAVVDLLGALAKTRVPRIVVARRVATELGYSTDVSDLLAAIDLLRKRLARARRAGRRSVTPGIPDPHQSNQVD